MIERVPLVKNEKNIEQKEMDIDTSSWSYKPEDFPKNLDPFYFTKKGYSSTKEFADELRKRYPEKLPPENIKLYRFVDNATGIRNGRDGTHTFWQTGEPNFQYSGRFLIITDSDELRKINLDLRIDPMAMDGLENTGFAVVAISNYPIPHLPGTRIESVGWANGQTPVYKNEKNQIVYLNGKIHDRAWEDHDGKTHFSDENE